MNQQDLVWPSLSATLRKQIYHPKELCHENIELEFPQALYQDLKKLLSVDQFLIRNLSVLLKVLHYFLLN
jgi:hypothetical protein